MKYDTAEIRRVARQVKQSATSIDEIGRGTLQPLTGSIPQELKGLAADALLSEIRDLTSGLQHLATQVSAVGDDLNAFARKLDIADQQAKQQIRSK